MEDGDLRVLRDADLKRFIELHNLAFVAVKSAAYGDHEERWARAAESVCNFLTFTRDENQLWDGLHLAIDALDRSRGQLQVVRDSLEEFTDAEYALLTRLGLDDGAVGQIVANVLNGLVSLGDPTHEDLQETREAVDVLTERLCGGVEDWSIFSEPERRARRDVNTAAALGGGGGLVAAGCNATAILVPPFAAGSIVGGAIAGDRSFCCKASRRRRR